MLPEGIRITLKTNDESENGNKCFTCGGDHMARNCPEKHILVTQMNADAIANYNTGTIPVPTYGSVVTDTIPKKLLQTVTTAIAQNKQDQFVAEPEPNATKNTQEPTTADDNPPQGNTSPAPTNDKIKAAPMPIPPQPAEIVNNVQSENQLAKNIQTQKDPPLIQIDTPNTQDNENWQIVTGKKTPNKSVDNTNPDSWLHPGNLDLAFDQLKQKGAQYAPPPFLYTNSKPILYTRGILL